MRRRQTGRGLLILTLLDSGGSPETSVSSPRPSNLCFRGLERRDLQGGRRVRGLHARQVARLAVRRPSRREGANRSPGRQLRRVDASVERDESEAPCFFSLSLPLSDASGRFRYALRFDEDVRPLGTLRSRESARKMQTKGTSLEEREFSTVA